VRTAASGGHGSDTELFPCPEEDDDQENGQGRFWTLAGKGEGKSWAGNGPKQGRFSFFSNFFLFSVFPKSFAILQKDFADSKLFMKT
jgi:hypothetical protein